MTISASVISSPSSVTRMRKTPWVDGCCGPMLTMSGSVLIATELASPLAGVFLREALEARLEAAGQRHEVLAQGMAREAFPEEHSLQVGVAAEANAHEVVDLALLEVGAMPDRHDGRHFRVVVVGAHL